MSAVVARPLYTPEDLLTMRDGDRYELVGGELVEREMGLLSSIVGDKVSRLLGDFVEGRRLGWTPSSECGYQCFPDDPRKVRKPDASFITGARLSADQLNEGHVKIPPDLAVEVVSPHDLFGEVQRKVGEYLRAGVRLVWVVAPEERTVLVHRPDGTASRLEEEDELSGEAVLPGFSCRVGDLFPPRATEQDGAGRGQEG